MSKKQVEVDSGEPTKPTKAPLNLDNVKEADKPAKGAVGNIIMIDALHVPGHPPRFKAGGLVRANVLARDPDTKQPVVVMHRAAKLPADCAVTVDEYIEEDLAKYRCTLARDIEDAK